MAQSRCDKRWRQSWRCRVGLHHWEITEANSTHHLSMFGISRRKPHELRHVVVQLRGDPVAHGIAPSPGPTQCPKTSVGLHKCAKTSREGFPSWGIAADMVTRRQRQHGVARSMCFATEGCQKLNRAAMFISCWSRLRVSTNVNQSKTASMQRWSSGPAKTGPSGDEPRTTEKSQILP